MPSPAVYLDHTRCHRIIGNLDYIKDGCARGWLADTHMLERELTVKIIIDGKYVLESLPNKKRGDVHAHLCEQYGFTERRNFGFLVPIPENLRDGKLHFFSVHVEGENDCYIGGAGEEYVID